METQFDTIKVQKVRHILDNMPDDTEISFEFMIASCFPKAYENFLSLLKDEHMKGYKQAMEEINNGY